MYPPTAVSYSEDKLQHLAEYAAEVRTTKFCSGPPHCVPLVQGWHLSSWAGLAGKLVVGMPVLV